MVNPLPLLVDNFEPLSQILPLLKQSIPAESADLNNRGFADYLWNAIDGHSIQVERKQNNELLGGLDRVELQLRKQYNKADETVLLIEGFIIPSHEGCTSIRQSGKWFKRDREYKGLSYYGFLSWLYQLDKAGVTHYFTPTLSGTASLLVAIYKNSQKEEHQTLQRYIKPKIYLMEENPHVRSLMGIAGTNIGEVKAKALIDRFGSLWDVLLQSEEALCQVEGIGKKIAKNLLKAIGRI